MYAADTFKAAQGASILFSQDARVDQYYDPNKLVGGAIAEGLGARPGEIAWDIYLFYDKTAGWGEQPPPPIEWVHQLGDSSWADPGRFYTGDGLYQALENSMDELVRGVNDI